MEVTLLRGFSLHPQELELRATAPSNPILFPWTLTNGLRHLVSGGVATARVTIESTF